MNESERRQEWAAAFQRASWGCAPAIGRALGLSARTIQQWGQTDQDKRSPGERLEIAMQVALEHRKAHDALAPLHLLATRFGYCLEAESRSEEVPATEDIARHATQTLIEAGEAVNAALRAIDDEIISREELDQIDRECDEAIEALTRLKQLARASA